MALNVGARGEAMGGPPHALGRFTLIEQIGEGGMARIFLARSSGIGGFEKLVVVKQVLPRLAEDADFVERFLQEARLAASLDHPNIAAVHEVGCDGGRYFYAMEYVRGRDVQLLLRRASAMGRVLRLDEVVAIVTALCAGLHHAHTHVGHDGLPLGIVHRDISPSNVLVSFEGAVKLTDFGVAKSRDAQVTTEAGTLRGKIPYMSPEQCRGEPLDRRSDVFAVGVLSWELLTGRRMRQGDELALMRAIADTDPPSPRVLRPELPAGLERVIMRALARDPAKRYSSAQALQHELEAFAREQHLSLAPRSVAELMQALFATELELATDDDELTRTLAFRHDDAGPRTPATTTLPGALRGSHEPTTATPARRGAPRLALGLVVGAVLGGGGLYVASRAGAVEDTGGVAGEPAPPPTVAAPPTASAELELEREDPPLRPTPSPEPEVAPAATTVRDEGGTPERRATARRSKRKPAVRPTTAAAERPTVAPTPALDLDAPFPPSAKPR